MIKLSKTTKLDNYLNLLGKYHFPEKPEGQKMFHYIKPLTGKIYLFLLMNIISQLC